MSDQLSSDQCLNFLVKVLLFKLAWEECTNTCWALEKDLGKIKFNILGEG